MSKCLQFALVSLLSVLFANSSYAEGDVKLDGKWVIISVERDGKADDTLKGAVREHKGEKYTMTLKEGKSFEGSMKVDATAKSIDLIPGDGKYKGKTLLGIYELDGDTLKICFAEPGKERPKTFVSKADSGIVLAVHKKEK